ncbi:MAG: hypothetical protein ACFFAO_17160, partial [Candidatus Hermodarchaeota archaeon]
MFNSLNKKFASLKEIIKEKSCFLGWDGFIDNLYHVVQSRKSLEKWLRMDTMKSFGQLIQNVAGSSAGIETILKRKTNGGFTANVCKGMNSLGVNIFLASAWGYPNIEDLFMSLAERQTIEVNSFTTPGITMGLEFNDGKIMLNNIESILKINWNLITERVGKEDLIEKMDRCELIGLGYWAVILE